MAPQPKHNWTDPAEKEWLRISYDEVAALPCPLNLKQRQRELFQRFKPKYINNLLGPETLWSYGKSLSADCSAILPREVPKPKPFWNDDTRKDLLCSAERAFLSSGADQKLNLFAGFSGVRTTFHNRQREEFLILCPQFTGDLSREITDLRSKGIFPEDPILQEEHHTVD